MTVRAPPIPALRPRGPRAELGSAGAHAGIRRRGSLFGVAAIVFAATIASLSSWSSSAAAMGAAGAEPLPAATERAAVRTTSTSHPGTLAQGSVVLAFVPADEPELADIPGMSVGILSATQGSYSAEQLLLDITQGARVANSAYPRSRPLAMSLRTIGSEGALTGWREARKRAEDAPQLLRPGLLAARIPGGAAYAGIAGNRRHRRNRRRRSHRSAGRRLAGDGRLAAGPCRDAEPRTPSHRHRPA